MGWQGGALWLSVVIISFYGSYVSLKEASSPRYPCHPNDESDEGNANDIGCLGPMLRMDGSYELELWTFVDDHVVQLWKHPERDGNDTHTSTESNETATDSAPLTNDNPAIWTKVETCQSIPINLGNTRLDSFRSDSLITQQTIIVKGTPRTSTSTTSTSHSDVDTTTKKSPSANNALSHCAIPLPELSRTRHIIGKYGRHRGKHGRNSNKRMDAVPLKAKFVLRETNGRIVAEASFELTRIVERKIRVDAVPSNNNSTTTTNSNSNQTHTVPVTQKVPHYKFRDAVVLRLVNEHRGYSPTAPYRVDGMRQKHNRNSRYYQPTLYVDETALRHSSQIEMSESSLHKKPVNLPMKITLISPLRDVLIRQIQLGMETASQILSPTELDEIRWLISDDHIYRFLLTQMIGFVHIWLDYLAFRDEVGFYVGRTDLGGLSVSSVLLQFLCSLIIFLYLCDAGGTSYLILGSVGSGVLVQGWKATKVLQPKLHWGARWPMVTFRDVSQLSDTEVKSKGYDRIATNYLGLILYPLCFGSALYARNHYSYKSYYSWIISNLANTVYTFGFIALCPQLYVNYKLRSVAHLPWKVFVYKLFNTFIDDVFAFLIEMPLKHKIMTLRDDVVFIGFLVQTYWYRVDKSRPNEFGYAYEEVTEDARVPLPLVDMDDSAEEDKLLTPSQQTSLTQLPLPSRVDETDADTQKDDVGLPLVTNETVCMKKTN